MDRDTGRESNTWGGGKGNNGGRGMPGGEYWVGDREGERLGSVGRGRRETGGRQRKEERGRGTGNPELKAKKHLQGAQSSMKTGTSL